MALLTQVHEKLDLLARAGAGRPIDHDQTPVRYITIETFMQMLLYGRVGLDTDDPESFTQVERGIIALTHADVEDQPVIASHRLLVLGLPVGL
jgi:hypothetical protein